MLLENKTAVIYGAGGAIGGAVARAFADAGARVYLAGRSKDRLEKVASDIGDPAGVTEVDALDEKAVSAHADAVAADAGGIDVAVNAVAFPFVHGVPFLEVSVKEVTRPIDLYLTCNLITAQAAARHMAARGSGTILTISTAASRFVAAGTLGYGTTGTAIEVVSERLAVELGPSGVRVVCLRPHAIADGPSHGSFATAVFQSRADAAGLGVEQWLERFAQDVTVAGQLPTVAEVADAAAFLASDRAKAITGTVIDLSYGNAVRTSAGFLARSLG